MRNSNIHQPVAFSFSVANTKRQAYLLDGEDQSIDESRRGAVDPYSNNFVAGMGKSGTFAYRIPADNMSFILATER